MAVASENDPPEELVEALRGVQDEKLDRLCSDDDLADISKSLSQWQVVSPYLGLKKVDEEDIIAKSDRVSAGLQRERLNALMTWKEKQKERATYRSLVNAFFHAQRLDLVDDVIKLLHSPDQPTLPTSSPAPLVQSPAHPPLSTSTPSSLTQYGDYLKEVYSYREDSIRAKTQFPPVDIKKAFNLAMIKKEKIERSGKIDDMFVLMTITGKVDDILHMKTPVELVDIFRIDQKKRKVILIEGAPGSGKSTLSWDICKRWEAGELFQEYVAVILVQLRDPEVQAATTLAKLLPSRNHSMAESVAEQIAACDGEKVLFVLDGWDELPSDLQSKSIYQDIIRLPNECTWHKSAIIVTSRPIASQKLHDLATSRVEIVGFTPQELTQYFSECLHGDSHKLETLLERVEENPVVASSCYLPLNAAIIIHLFLSGDYTLPTTNHGIFTSLVQCCLARYQRVRLGLEGEAANIDTLDNLPKKLQKPFRKLCRLAFSGVMEDKVTFSSAQLEAVGIRTEELELGLLQALSSLVSSKVTTYYNFLHLQIQELLAAYHISFLPASEQMSHFEKLFDHPRFSAVFQFFAGVTRFEAQRKYLSKVAFLLPTQLFPMGMRDVLANMIRSRNKNLLVSVIRCLFEADDLSLCQFVARQLYGQLNLSFTTLSPLDCLSVGYFLSCVCATTSGQFAVYLYCCSIGDNGCKFLMRGLSRCPAPNSTPTGQLTLWLWSNQIHQEGAHCIAHLLKGSSVIRVLDLGLNTMGGSGLKSVADALTTNSSLVELNLLACSLAITEDNKHVLRTALQSNNTLQNLVLNGNPGLSDTGAVDIAQGLKHNSSLRVLNLDGCGIGDEGVGSIGEALTVNNTLEVLRLYGNDDNISENGLAILVEGIKVNNRLLKLRLPERFSSSNIQLQETVNVARKRNGAPLIRVD